MPKSSARRRILPRTRRGRLLLAGLAVLAVGLIGWAVWANNQAADKSTDNPNEPGYVNLDPPTGEEIRETEQHKKDLENSGTPQPTTNSSGKLVVTPTVTSVQPNMVSGYVMGVFEDGGTCTVTLTKGGQTVTGTSKGFKNVSYTTCEPINLNTSLSGGTWSVVLSYNSDKAEGASAAKDFTVN